MNAFGTTRSGTADVMMAASAEAELHVGRPNVGDREHFLSLVSEILDNNWLTNNGPMVQRFEKEVALRLGVRNCVAMCNGTIALEIAIRAMGLSGEVIVPSWTFIATAHALAWQGITPVFADIDPRTHNLDPDAVRKKITPRTTGIIGVHLWGRPAPVDSLQEIADEFGLKLMFDAAHAFGSTLNGVNVGNFGSCEVFSFHATKSFNTMEGGAVVTNNDELAETVRLMRNFGFSGYDNVTHPGTNGKMMEMCAAMGLVNLEGFGGVCENNRTTYNLYRQELDGIPGINVIEYHEEDFNSHHYIVVEVEGDSLVCRDRLVELLHSSNILARKYFWPGCHRMSPYRDMFPSAAVDLPSTEKLSDRVLVLPGGPLVSVEDVRRISKVIATAVTGSAV